MFSLASMRIRKWFAWGLLPPLLMGAEQLRYPCWPHYNSVQIPCGIILSCYRTTALYKCTLHVLLFTSDSAWISTAHSSHLFSFPDSRLIFVLLRRVVLLFLDIISFLSNCYTLVSTLYLEKYLKKDLMLSLSITKSTSFSNKYSPLCSCTEHV